jgi:hypothetical protein
MPVAPRVLKLGAPGFFLGCQRVPCGAAVRTLADIGIGWKSY